MSFVLCINLKRRIDKRGAFVGGMRAMGVPEKSIRFFDAYDGMEYADRFEIVEQMSKNLGLQGLDGEWVEKYGESGTLCASWSYMECLKEIASQTACVVLMLDHTIFKKWWQEIVGCVEVLGDFDVFQIQYNSYRSRRFDNPPFEMGEVNYNLAGAGDCCMVLSPRGAQKALDFYIQNPYWNTTRLWEEISRESGWECYSTQNPDDWVLYPLELYPFTGLPDSERELINKVKGTGANSASHFYYPQRFADLTIDHFKGRRGEYVSSSQQDNSD